MSPKLKVILLYGGKSGEHEISLLSAASVLKNLNPSLYDIIPIAMDKDGSFYVNDYHELVNCAKFLPVKTTKSHHLKHFIVNSQLTVAADVVFPMVHGPLYEDGSLQGLLQLVNVAYVGSTVVGSAIGMDKELSRKLTLPLGINSAQSISIHTSYPQEKILALCKSATAKHNFPLFVKPNTLGSSVGIHKVNNLDELLDAVKDAMRFDTTILIEEYIKGMELEVAVLENIDDINAPIVSLPGEIKLKNNHNFYSYTAKYLDKDSSDCIIPAVLENEIVEKLQLYSAQIFKQLKCQGMARIDYFYDPSTKQIYFSEINTIPGFTEISYYPKLMAQSGYEYSELLNNLIELALYHHKLRVNLITHYQ